MGKKRYALFMLVVLFVWMCAPASTMAKEVLKLDSSKEQYDLAPYIEILEDKEKKWTIADVSSRDFVHRFSLSQITRADSGYASSVYWIRFQVENDSSYQAWWLEMGFPPLDHMLINQLMLNGHDVITATSGREALQMVKQEVFDLLILDVMMPDLSGYEVCRIVRKDYSLTDLPILILTAKQQLEDIVAAFEAGANDYLAKPFDKRELLARVNTLLDLRKAMIEIQQNAVELNRLNEELSKFNHKLEEKIKERTKQLEQIQWEHIEAQAEKSILRERNRIAKDMHDVVGHTLTATVIQIEAGKRLLLKDPILAQEKMELAQQLVRKGLDDIRHALRMLREKEFQLDLLPALEHLIKEAEKYTGVTIESYISVASALTSMQKKAVYHALQEGITNGIRHGKCTHFTFRLEADGTHLLFHLKDDGQGCEAIKPGFGISTMKERIEELGGILILYTEVGSGCCLEIQLPLEET